MLREMSRINVREGGNSIFPCGLYEVEIFSNDDNVPHFHILSNGCDVSFTISDGELYKVESIGNAKTYEYIMSNVKEWLVIPCTAQPKLTNQENASLQWYQVTM